MNLLPGLRDIRAPLVSGYLWLVLFFLVFHEDLPSKSNPGPVLQPLFDLVGDLSVVGLATVSGVAAYLVGSALQELWKLLGRVLSRRRPLYGEAGARASAAGRRDIEDAVRIRVQGIRRELFQIALSPGEKGVDEEPSAETVERELPLVRTLLLGERKELVDDLDRIQSEADLRITVAFPLVFFSVFMAWETGALGWLAIVFPAGLLLVQGYQRYLAAGDLLAKALRIGQADAPALAALKSSVEAVLQRVELEGALRREMDGGDGMAAFRLGNMQVSWEDFEAAVISFEVATRKGIVRAYAQLGLVHERRGETDSAERAYRDGSERSDRKASELLSDLLARQLREEEAREAVSQAGGREAGEEALGRRTGGELPARIESYRRRMKDRDVKAAINLGLLLGRTGDLRGSQDAFEKATEFDGSDAQAWFGLGETREAMGLYRGSRQAFERSLHLWEAQLGPDHLEVAIALGNLGISWRQLGDSEKAKEMQERALGIKEKQLDADSPSVAVTLSNLGNSLDDLGQHEQGLRLLERALKIYESRNGFDHISVVPPLDSIAAIRRTLGEYDRSEDLFRRGQAIAERNDEKPALAILLRGLAETLRQAGRASEALPIVERAAGLQREALGESHPELARTLDVSARVLASLDQHELAEEAIARAGEIREEFGLDW